MDSTHSPEFAMLEAYEAYGDYNTVAALTRATRAGGRHVGLRVARGPSS
jgi:hypothetical protein